MVRNDTEDISNEDYQNIIIPLENLIHNYIKNNIINEFVAYDFYIRYKNNVIWNEPVNNIINSLVDDIIELTKSEDVNIDIVKEILLNKYKIKIVSEIPLYIKEIED